MGADPKRLNVIAGMGCSGRNAFTLVELLVVMGIIALLAALMLPGLHSAKIKTKQASCLNHLRQLAVASQVYWGDNNGLLLENLPSPRNANSWVTGDVKYYPTNETAIREGLLFRYLGVTGTYRCPAEEKPRVLSYSMNGWLGSRTMETQYQQKGYRTFVRDSEIAITAMPAGLWMFAGEHSETMDDGWFLVRMDDYQPFASFPGARHQGSFGLNFADGHASTMKLVDPTSRVGSQVGYQNADWTRFKQMTTTR
jgi:prepilin-type N-terminal cleavage/methylation domain-containing protein/prepilin-type processing-associated H-X9-DG protein